LGGANTTNNIGVGVASVNNIGSATSTNTITGATTNLANTTLNVTGATTNLNSTNTNINGALDVNGTTTLSGNVTVDNGADVVLGAGSDLTVNGATVTNGLTNFGNLTTSTLTTTSDASVGGNLAVTGTTTLTGQLAANGGIVTNGANIAAGAGIVSGAVGAFSTAVSTPVLTNGGPGGAGVTVADDLNVSGTLSTAGAGPLVVADNLTVTGNEQVNGNSNISGQLTAGNAVGAANQVGGANATSTRIAAGTSYVDVTQSAVNIHGGTSSSNLLVDDAGFAFTNDNVGAAEIANGTGAALFISANGSISSTNAAVAGGAVNVNDSLNVVNNLTVAGTGAFTGSLAANGGITSGTINVNNATSGANKISGLANGTLSAASTDAVTGQQLFATNQSILAFQNQLNLTNVRVDKANQGVAMGFAMNAAPISLANGEGGISGGVGYYQGEVAGAVKAQYVTDSGVGLGINVGFSSDAVGGGVGASIKF
jgi:trimeric autotransporter adhesin